MSESSESRVGNDEEQGNREIIQLLVGDHLFRVDKRILLSVEETFFTRLLSGRWENGDGPIRIERNADPFDAILRHLKTKSKLAVWGWKLNALEELAVEADFYGLTGLHREVLELIGNRKCELEPEFGTIILNTGEIPIENTLKMMNTACLLFRFYKYSFNRFMDLLEKFKNSTLSNKMSRYAIIVKIVEPTEKSYVNIVDPWMGPLYYLNGIEIFNIDNQTEMQQFILWAMLDHEREAVEYAPKIPKQGFIYEYTQP